MPNPLEKCGSNIAMSLAANPELLPVVIGVAGTALTIGAAVFVYTSFKNYEEKKHLAEIKAINALHAQFLEKMPIGNHNTIRGFPPIFQLKKQEGEGEHYTIDSMHFTEAEVEAIGQNTTEGADIALSGYRQSILNAVLKLKEYYIAHPNKIGTTAGVLCYLMYMLESKCLHFEGYDYDIAYVKGLLKFVDGYALKEDSQYSQHYSRLTPVHAYLQEALEQLEKHKETLLLEERFAELRKTAADTANELIRSFAALIIPEEKQPLTKTATIQELQSAILRQEYIKTSAGISKWRFSVRTDDREMVPTSPFQKWLAELADYYLKALDPDSDLTDVRAPEVMFAYPNPLTTPNLTPEQKKDWVAIENLFKHCKNFVTTKATFPNKKSDTPEFVPVTETKDMIPRIQVLVYYGALIHKLISLLRLSTHLIKSLKQLGEIYIKDPHHFRKIFAVLNALCDDIKVAIKAMKDGFIAIQNSNKRAILLKHPTALLDAIHTALDSLNTTLKEEHESITQYRATISPNDPTIATVRKEIHDVAESLAKLYKFINSDPNIPNTAPPPVIPHGTAPVGDNASNASDEGEVLLEESDVEDTHVKTPQLPTHPPKQESQAEIAFREQLILLAAKSVEFKMAFKLYPKRLDYKTAHDAAHTLHTSLHTAADTYFNGLQTQETYNHFKETCNTAMELARPELEKHHGWKQILINIGLAIAGLGIFYAGAVIIHGISTKGKHWLFFGETTAVKRVKAIENHILSITPQIVPDVVLAH